nr:MAG TPA: hypothetical protein [Caudoviricetes sp.]
MMVRRASSESLDISLVGPVCALKRGVKVLPPETVSLDAGPVALVLATLAMTHLPSRPAWSLRRQTASPTCTRQCRTSTRA